jgi:hypothetical protein
VADPGEELGARPVELGQRLDPALRGVIGLGVGDGGADLAGHEVDEGAVVPVEPR